jgi:6-phosphofructokinase 1
MKIAVLTSGGDAPGMNAAIRAVVRAGLEEGWEVYGVRKGYSGLMDGLFDRFTARMVGGIVQRGGTILGSSRCLEFYQEEGRLSAIKELRDSGIGAVVVIGGDGSQAGAFALSGMGFPTVGVASTIDNDLAGSDITIGADTAINIAVEAIDRLKITASSHQRAFLVEVMGRNCGYLALVAGLAGGAEVVLVPEVDMTPEAVARELRAAYERGKAHAIAVVAEGARYDAGALAAYFKEHEARIFDLRTTILGHVQRGGAPTVYDRVLGTRLGAAAVGAPARGESGVLVGIQLGKVATTPLASVVGVRKPLDPDPLRLARTMSQ